MTNIEPGLRPEPRAMGNLFGREDAILALLCTGCATQLTRSQVSTWPDATQHEYTVSGLCRNCQIRVFGEDPTKCTCDDPCCSVDVGVGVVTCAGQHCLVHGSNRSEAPA